MLTNFSKTSRRKIDTYHVGTRQTDRCSQSRADRSVLLDMADRSVSVSNGRQIGWFQRFGRYPERRDERLKQGFANETFFLCLANISPIVMAETFACGHRVPPPPPSPLLSHLVHLFRLCYLLCGHAHLLTTIHLPPTPPPTIFANYVLVPPACSHAFAHEYLPYSDLQACMTTITPPRTLEIPRLFPLVLCYISLCVDTSIRS